MAVRSAVASVPARLLLARLRSTPAVAAATCWRRTLSSGNENADGQRKPEEMEEARNKRELEERRSKYQAEEARRRLKDEITQDVLKALTSHDALDLFILENAVTKQRLEFKRKFHELSSYFEMKKLEAEMEFDKNVEDVRNLFRSFENKCLRNESKAEKVNVVMMDKQNILQRSKDARILQARISMFKALAYVYVTVGGGCVTMYCRLKGIKIF